MDYLRTLGSAAVSSLVQKSGLNLPFSLGPKIESGAIWSLYDGTKREDGSNVSIFECEISDAAKKKYAPLAKNTLRKLRTTRHPDVLKFMDAVETESVIYIMTERVKPLSTTLPKWSAKSAQEREAWLIWGLHRISVALAFINDPCASTHGNICVDSIYISPSGEWKLGGFELFSNPKDEAAVLYTFGSLVPGITAWSCPEVRKSGWSDLKQYDPSIADAYALGLLLHSVFNPNQGLPATASPPHPPSQPSSRGAIPTNVFNAFKRLLNPNHKARLSPKGFLEIGMIEDGGFFSENRLVKVCSGLDNFALGNESEKNAFLRTLKESATSFPTEFASFRVLPSLISALEYGGASAATITPLVLQFGKNVPSEDYATVILAPLIKLWASPDRGTRMALLDHLEEYADRLDKKTVGEIWVHLQTGFSDTVAVIREATVRSIILLSPKFSDRVLNNDLLRYLAKLQTDPEASIRTNTCILLGRLGPTLGYNTKRKVLVPAFTRALKDSFVHARVAGVMALMATIDCFELEEIATRVVPSVSPALVDGEKLVRDQAFKAIALFVQKLETHAATLPETLLTDSAQADAAAASLPYSAGQNGAATGGVVNTAAGAAGALAGWAISSLGKRLAVTDMQSVMISAAGASIERALSAPPPPGSDASRPNNLLSVPMGSNLSGSAFSTPSTPAFTGPTPGSSSRAKGMQLGSSKVPVSTLAMQIAEDEGAGDNPWGGDDLIDVNADQDDWSAFETAPTPTAVSGIHTPKPTKSSNTTIGLGFGNDDADPWDEPRIVTPTPRKVVAPMHGTPNVGRTPLPSTSSSMASSSWDAPGEWDTAVEQRKSATTSPSAPSTVNMTKEEKAAEMARRKEERKQRIAQLKEQKKHATTGKP